jgi:hypothetical protein
MAEEKEKIASSLEEHQALAMTEELKEQNSEPEEIQVRLSASGQVNPAGRFEVDVITVGVGNGFQFSEEVLRESLSLWDGATCFVDHGSWFGGRSVKDIAGVFSNPRWCEDSKGIRMDLSAIGPSGKLVDELGRQILAEEIKPRVGFSADVVFTAKGREVQKIMRVLEVCLVYNPARGGAFVRAMNSIHGGFEMSDKPNNGSHAEHGNQSTGSRLREPGGYFNRAAAEGCGGCPPAAGGARRALAVSARGGSRKSCTSADVRLPA